jgi:flavin reductase (DIM6/NTAB) family NADH-FMN oxidoreductase RutF
LFSHKVLDFLVVVYMIHMGLYHQSSCAYSTTLRMVRKFVVVGVHLEPRWLWSVIVSRRRCRAWPQIERSGRFAASVVAASMAKGLAHFVANRGDRFAQIPLDTSPGGLPIPRDASAWIECAVEGTHRIGDHDLIVGRPLALAGRADSTPLVFHSRQFKVVSAAG